MHAGQEQKYHGSLPTVRATVRGGYVYYVAEYDTVLDLNLNVQVRQ